MSPGSGTAILAVFLHGAETRATKFLTAPRFCRFLLATPENQREGKVFNVTGIYAGNAITPKRVSRVVSAIGKKAKVVVDKGTEKFASAHDFRRAFGTRWARKVMPMVLQKLMRHDSIETTMRYYVDLDADEMAEELWKADTKVYQHFYQQPLFRSQESRKGARPGIDRNSFTR